MAKYLDSSGLTQLWTACKNTFLTTGGGDGRYLKLSGGTLTGAVTLNGEVYSTYHISIGYPTSSYSLSRAEMDIITEADDATDLWMGVNKSRCWDLSCRGSSLENKLVIYNKDVLQRFYYTQDGLFYAYGGFVKQGSSANYVLLGNGGHKAITDFATSDHTHSYFPLSGGNLNGPLTLVAPGNDIASFQSQASIGVVSLKGNGTYGTRLDIYNKDNTECVVCADYNGRVTAKKFIISGGTSSQFLKADGSVDSNSYSTTSHTHSNVASATKLQTSRKLWGNSFDGTADVTGQITIKHATGLYHYSADGSQLYMYLGHDGTQAYTHLYNGQSGQYIRLYDAGNVEVGGNLGVGVNPTSYKLQVSGSVYSTTGYYKKDSSNNEVLLGGGGTKAISDFATSDHTHSYLSLSGGTLTGAVTFGGEVYSSHISIGHPTTSYAWASRAEMDIITAADEATDLWMGVNKKRCWDFSCRNDASGNRLDIYNKDISQRFYYTQDGLFYAYGGFVKNGSDANHVLLGNGGHKAISDFATSSHNHSGVYHPYQGSSDLTISCSSLSSFDGINVINNTSQLGTYRDLAFIASGRGILGAVRGTWDNSNWNDENVAKGHLSFIVSTLENGPQETLTLANNGNIGIGGITSPAEKIETNGNILLGSGGKIMFRYSTSSTGGASISRTNGTAYSDHTVGDLEYLGSEWTSSPDVLAHKFKTANAPNALCIQNSGNIGVNTTSPAYKFDVSGSLNATTIYQNGTQVSVNGHTHSYLPLSGGTISNVSTYPLKITNTTGNAVGIILSQDGSEGGILLSSSDTSSNWGTSIINVKAGYKGIGVTDSGVPFFGSGPTNTLLHSGNWSTYCAAASHTHSYLPLSGGTLTGKLTVSSTSSNRAEIDMISAADVPNDLYWGNNGSKKFSISSRGSDENNDLLFYSTSAGSCAYLRYSTGVFEFKKQPTVNGNSILHAGNHTSLTNSEIDAIII